MFLEFLSHALVLDFAWMASIFLHNLHYFFIFAALAFFFFTQKGVRFVFFALLLGLYCWAWVDFSTVTGWAIFGSAFLMIYYLSKVAILIFAETVPELRNRLVIVSTVVTIFVLVSFNTLLRLGVF